MKTDRIKVVRESVATRIASLLIKRSAWFQMEPQPDDYWEFQFKTGEGHLDECLHVLSNRELVSARWINSTAKRANHA